MSRDSLQALILSIQVRPVGCCMRRLRGVYAAVPCSADSTERQPASEAWCQQLLAKHACCRLPVTKLSSICLHHDVCRHGWPAAQERGEAGSLAAGAGALAAAPAPAPAKAAAAEQASALEAQASAPQTAPLIKAQTFAGLDTAQLFSSGSGPSERAALSDQVSPVSFLHYFCRTKQGARQWYATSCTCGLLHHVLAAKPPLAGTLGLLARTWHGPHMPAGLHMPCSLPPHPGPLCAALAAPGAAAEPVALPVLGGHELGAHHHHRGGGPDRGLGRSGGGREPPHPQEQLTPRAAG